MAKRCEIRPRETKDGWNLRVDHLCLWYPRLESAVSYAEGMLRDCEVAVYDEVGKVVQSFGATRVNNALNAW